MALPKKKKHKKKIKRGRSSWVMYILVLALMAFVTMGLLAEENHQQMVAPPPESHPLSNLNHGNLHLGNFLKRTSGLGWQMWDKKSPIRTKFTKHKKCRWTTFKATNGQTAKICTHYGDAVSRAIINRGRWADCDILTKQFQETNPDKTSRLYMDIGANIGSCVLQMLFTTDAPIVAFEPEPMNLFCMTSTILQLEPQYQDRVVLFPFAVGEEAGETIINSQVGDFGNAVIGGVIKDRHKEKFKHPLPIRVEPLDSVLTAEHENISLIKLHASGHECQVLNGMPHLLSHTKAIHTEVSKKHLDMHACSEEAYIKLLEDTGFHVMGEKKILTDPEQRGSTEIFAVNQKLIQKQQKKEEEEGKEEPNE